MRERSLASVVQAIAGIFVISTVLMTSAANCNEHSLEKTIYDSQVLKHIKFSAEQMQTVKAILQRSDREMLGIFAKYGIDPRAKPNFDKLREARYELQALETREKRQMKQVMTRAQFKYYLGLLQQTAARVIKATRNRP